MKNKKTFIEEIEKETLQSRYIREDIIKAKQEGWNESKKYFKNKILKIIENQKICLISSDELNDSYLNKDNLIEKIKEL